MTKRLGVDEFISGLSHLFEKEFTGDQVLQFLVESEVDEDSLAPYVKFGERSYTRNLIHRGELFEAVLLCWEPGQHSPVHRHLDQLGWMTVLKGQLFITTFIKLRSLINESDVPDINWSPVNSIFLRPDHQFTVGEGDSIVEVNQPETIHRTENPMPADPSSTDQQAISLHVCWHPSTISVIYDVENHRCRTVRMRYV